jgi:hypothetical protein
MEAWERGGGVAHQVGPLLMSPRDSVQWLPLLIGLGNRNNSGWDLALQVDIVSSTFP